MVMGHAVKGRWHEVELEAFEHPTVLVDVGCQILSQL